MQGYIIDIKPVKDDDLIVAILTEHEVLTTYRFYGARHSNINLGYKIDFELENTRANIPRLKDVIQPIKLFQIISPGLREDFPPLKTLDSRPNNLPVQLTSFIGRRTETARLCETLAANRFVTLTGAGGSGKTRLAVRVAS